MCAVSWGHCSLGSCLCLLCFFFHPLAFQLQPGLLPATQLHCLVMSCHSECIAKEQSTAITSLIRHKYKVTFLHVSTDIMLFLQTQSTEGKKKSGKAVLGDTVQAKEG